MKQIISASLLLITLMLPSNFSFASARWVNAESTPDFNTYVDSQTVSYNKDDNNITYWIKRTSPPAYGYTFMEQHSCNLTEKKIDILKSITYKQEILQRSTNTPHSYVIRITPDSPAEHEVNTACSTIGLAPVLGVSTHRWKWIHSTDKTSYSICVDQKEYNPATGRALIYIKKTYLNGRHWTQAYVCNLKENTLTTSLDESNNDQKFIVPDSIEERIFNAAVILCKQ